MNELLPSTPPRSSARWIFLRDVAVFQLKMIFDNLRDFALIPVSLGAAALDLISRGEREGALFYKVLEWGAHSEKVIGVYSCLERENGDAGPNYSVDAVVARLEDVIVRECEKGGTAASVKAAVDRAIDQLHKETKGPRDKATELIVRATQKLRGPL